jgi:hypothetical protein
MFSFKDLVAERTLMARENLQNPHAQAETLQKALFRRG